MSDGQTTRRVLLVDDSSTSRMITRRCFEMAFQSPLEFVEAPDGAEALSLLEESQFDLIITDLNMPKMDGTTFAWKVRKTTAMQDTPIIVLSSQKNEETESALGALGVKEFIQKPLSPAKLLESVGWE